MKKKKLIYVPYLWSTICNHCGAVGKLLTVNAMVVGSIPTRCNKLLLLIIKKTDYLLSEIGILFYLSNVCTI